MNIKTLTDDLKRAFSVTNPAPSLLDLQRNDVPGAIAVARALQQQSRLDSGVLQILIQMQDNPAELEARLGEVLGEDEP